MKALIDGRDIHSLEELHQAFREQLGFPDYYGRNFAALYDCLGDLGEDTVIELRHRRALKKSLGEKYPVLREVLRDASRHNPRLRIR